LHYWNRELKKVEEMMRNKKNSKRGVGLAGTFGVPVTPVVLKGDPNAGETLAQYKRRVAAEAKAEQEKTLREFERVNTRLATEYFEVLRQFWGRDIAVLEKVMSRKEALEQIGCVDDIGLPTGGTRDETVAGKATGKATRAFVSALPSRGISLNDDGKARFMMYIYAQIMGLDVAITEQSLQTMLDRFISVGAFRDGEVTIDRSKQPRKPEPPASEPKPSIDDLEKIAITAGTDSERRARHLVTTLMTAEIQPIADRWFEHLIRDYNFYLTDSQLKWVLDWFGKTGANPMIHESWNAARRAAVDATIFPGHLKTRDELLCQSIERGEALSALGFNERQELFTQIKRMREPE
jgi:hypothetical protein